MPMAATPSDASTIWNCRRGFGSLNLASKTLRAVARSAACGSSNACPCAAAWGGAISSLRISRGCRMSGSSARVSTGFSGTGASPSMRNSGPAGSPFARRCASSLAFSAFFSASRSRLMSVDLRVAARVLARHLRRRGARRVGTPEEIVPRHLVAVIPVVALQARIPDHGGAKEDHKLGLGREIGAVRQQLADQRNAAQPRDAGLVVLNEVLHQAREHRDLAVLQAQDGIELAGFEHRDVVLGVLALQRRVRIAHAVDAPADGGAHVE